MIDRESPNDRVLSDVGVLILIDENVFEASIEVGANVGMFLENGHEMNQEVIEINGRRLLEFPLITAIDLSGDRVDMVAAGSSREGVGREKIVLGLADRAVEARTMC